MKPTGIVMALLLSPLALQAAEVRQVLSPVYRIDQKFKSMEGPMTTERIRLVDSPTPELLWLTGVETEMVGADGLTPALPELMCHVNVDIDVAQHQKLFGSQKAISPRIVTLSQGQQEALLPEGFGFPLLSNEEIILTTQVLNHNIDEADLSVRHKVTFRFVRDRDARGKIRPVYPASIFGMALIEHAYQPGEASHEDHGQSCLVRPQAKNSMSGSEYRDEQGRTFTGHWVVAPGREENTTNVTQMLSLPFDTTLHHAAVHLHPFARSLTLRDATTGEVLFRSEASQLENGVGLSNVTSFSSRKGVRLRRSHKYELTSLYENTTEVDQDSMAVMYLALADREFRRPALLASDESSNPRLVLTTLAGEMEFVLYPQLAPETVEQIVNLVRAGVYDGLHFPRIEKGFVAQISTVSDRREPLTAAQQSMVRRLPLEASTIPHERGVLSMARWDEDPDSGETSFSVLLGKAPHLDGKYTLFGRLVRGEEVLETIEGVPQQYGGGPAVRVEVLRAEIRGGKAEMAEASGGQRP